MIASAAVRLTRAAAGALAVVLGMVGALAEGADSVYTSIRQNDCVEPPAEVKGEFARADLGVQQCPAPADWQLLFVASHSNSWLELRRGALIWSSERAVVYEQPIGLFPTAGDSPFVEWRRGAEGAISALIFRVVAQDPADPERRVSRLFVVRLGRDCLCLLGRVATNQAARALADGPAACSERPPG